MRKIMITLLVLASFVLTQNLQAEEVCQEVCELVCQEQEETVEYDYSQTVIINELYPQPNSGEEEFIELKNIGSQTVDLTGWYLTDAANKKYELSSELDDYLVIEQADSKIYLNNSGDTVNLYQPDGTLLDTVTYDNSGERGWSYSLNKSDQWEWSTQATPGEKNKIVKTTTEEEENEEEDEKDQGSESLGEDKANKEDYDYSEEIQISELLPNPEGSDSGEWIELYNFGQKKINLFGWQLSDGKATYQIKEDVKIKSQEYKVFYYEQTHISLNNSGETIYLFDPDEKKIDSVTYQEAKEGWSYAFFDNQWFWTNTLTPQKRNIISEESEDDSVSSEDQLESNEEEGIEEAIEQQSILEVRALNKGTEVLVEGVVTVEPGVLTSQTFYIEDDTAGIQIYSSKKTFPELSIGDLIQVQGEVSEAYGEKKINIRTEEQIELIGEAEINMATVEAIGEELEGQLVSTESQVIDKASNKIYLANGITIYIKAATDISLQEYAEGDLLLVTGIVGEYKGEYRLMPRSSEDIEVLSKYQTAATNETKASIIKTAHAAEKSDSTWALPPVEDEQKVIKYLLIVIVILLVGIGIIFWKSDLPSKLIVKIIDYADKKYRLRSLSNKEINDKINEQ